MTSDENTLPGDHSFILAVDDDPASLQVVARCLQEHYTVRTAANAEQALEILRQRIPALVIMDAMMAEISGIDLCLILKTNARLRRVPVMFIASSGSPRDYKAGHDAGAVMYLTKPIRHDQLLQMVGLFAGKIARRN